MKNSWNQPHQVAIEVDNAECRVRTMMGLLKIEQFNIADIRGSSSGSIRHLVEWAPDKVIRVPRHMLTRNSVGFRHAGKSALWIESKGCAVCNTIISHGAFLVSGRGTTGSTITYSFLAPNFDAYKGIISTLEKRKFKVRLLKVGKTDSRREVLTETQHRILWIALQTGYFDYPKRINSAELSSRLGISPATLTETTRRGIRRLLENYYRP
jgi:predicted DNA binding protein